MTFESIQGPLIGGLLIGAAAASLLFLTGKGAGVSGALFGAITREKGESSWQTAFMLGLLAGGILLRLVLPSALPEQLSKYTLSLVCAGLLVGFGTRMGGGCTSGHGVCGIGKLSRRSIAATITFMAAGAAVVFVSRHVTV